MEPEKGAMSMLESGEGALFIEGLLLVLPRRERELGGAAPESLSFPFRPAYSEALDMIFERKGFTATLLDL